MSNKKPELDIKTTVAGKLDGTSAIFYFEGHNLDLMNEDQAVKIFDIWGAMLRTRLKNTLEAIRAREASSDEQE